VPVPSPKPANWTDPVAAAQNQLAKDQAALTQAQNQEASTQLKDKQQVASATTALGNAQNSAASAGGTNVTSAQLAVDTDKANLAACNLTSPVAGTVTSVSATAGALTGSSSASSGGSSGAASGGAGAASSASSGSSSSGGASSGSGLVTISDTGHLQVVAGFSESDVTSMKPDQTAQFTFPALAQDPAAAPVTGKVVSIAQTASTTNGVVTYPVTVSIANPPAGLKLGQSANISVTTATADDALVVPSLAITTAGNRQTVNVLKNGTPTPVTVTTGISANGRTQVLTGLAEGDQVELPAISSTLDTGSTPTGGGFGAGGLGGGGNRGGARNGGQ